MSDAIGCRRGFFDPAQDAEIGEEAQVGNDDLPVMLRTSEDQGQGLQGP